MSENTKDKQTPLTFIYGNRVITLPGNVSRKLPNASPEELKILIAAADNPSGTPEEICAACGIADVSAYATALSFWRGAGVISGGAGHISAVKKKADDIVVSVPAYTAEEVSEIADKNTEIRHMLDECTRILGRTLGETDNIKLVSCIEYFNITTEYLLLVCAHCARNGKKSVGAVVNSVSDFYKSGIENADQLNEKLLGIEKTAKLETQVRQLVGMNMSRELTPRESGFIRTWGDEYGYGIDVIRMAYEITVDAIGEPVLAYMDKILAGWHGDGLNTPEQIKAKADARKDAKKSKKDTSDTADSGRSFDTDDFFAAAMARTYGNNPPPVPESGADSGRNVGKITPIKPKKK